MDKILQGFMQALENVVTKDEFLKAWEGIVTQFKKTEATLTEKVDARLAELKDGPPGKDGKDGKNGRDGKDGRDGRDGLDGRDGEQGPPGPPGKDGDIKDLSPEEIRNALELLLGDDRLKTSAISGLDEAIADIKQRATRVQTPAKAYMIHNKDVSSQCDGSNKTFSVGGTHFGIVGVYGTQHPIIYRPVIDYTITRTGILLTSAVSAPESGQSLVIQFLK